MNQNTAIRLMLWLLGAVMLFHFGIILHIIPYEITWGGRLRSDSEMYVFETISIIINLFLFSILLIKGRYISELIPMRIVTILLRIFLVLFALNTVGNLFASTHFEKFFSLLTLASAILMGIILIKGKKRTHNKA